ncbi:preprotein translocase subunit SecA [Patescibacteria group bacterium]|nr:preprotein translocase subunit SecA [Patescibacteria group bacterium]
MAILGKLFGGPNKKNISNLEAQVEQVEGFREEFAKIPIEAFSQKSEKFKNELQSGKTLDDILPEAFALAREAAKRAINQFPYKTQVMGGLVLHQGKISEMKTGEGKTLAATMPLYLNALAGKGAHLVTVNDYLSKRDTAWMGRIYNLLGISVGCVQHDEAFLFDPSVKSDVDSKTAIQVDIELLRPVSRREAYQADITYGTNNEFGFDYLRDNMVQIRSQMVQRELNYAIVDEVDSILIDEARTPLIISAPDEEATDQYYKFAQLVNKLEEGPDYNIDEKMRAATLTEQGITSVEKSLGIENLYAEGGISLVHHIEQSLKAKALFKLDRDYVIKEGEIVIVDEFTGRLMPGRRYSEGLHQAIEAKENVEIKKESKTLASITFQNYFRMFKKLAGMTGTAATEAEEFSKIYGLEVMVIPTNKTLIRNDKTDQIFKTEEAKFKAIVNEVKQRNEKGQPVLIGTISIEKNELLGQLLDMEGVPHKMLNAKQHEQEANIIAQAGKDGAVTVATNMAGRGVDIILGGNPPDETGTEKVLSAGGLFVIGTERHESRRIDNQLRGRSGRQGDPGETQFFVSMEDDLMRIFGSDRMKGIMERLGIPDDMPIQNKMISRSLESAQKKVEGNNFDIRKHLVEYDDVINKHREVIYKKRHDVLNSEAGEEGYNGEILKMIESEIEQVVSFHTASEDEDIWDIEEIYEVADTIFPVTMEARVKMEDIHKEAGTKLEDAESRTHLIKYLIGLAHKEYKNLETRVGDENLMRNLERVVVLRVIDRLWIDHLSQMEHLRTGIGLRGYGQRDPLIEYKKEAYQLFTTMMASLQNNVAHTIYKIGLAKEIAPSMMQANQITQAPSKTMNGQHQHFTVPMEQPQAANDTFSQTKPQALPGTKVTEGGKLKTIDGEKVGRNDPCPCGSGKKFKKCHGQ